MNQSIIFFLDQIGIEIDQSDESSAVFLFLIWEEVDYI